jgi:hypothetical protein
VILPKRPGGAERISFTTNRLWSASTDATLYVTTTRPVTSSESNSHLDDWDEGKSPE